MKKNKDIILNRAKEYYINNKESIKDYQNEYRKNNPLREDKKQKMKDQKQYRENNLLTEDKKQKVKEYQKQYKKNMTDDQKQKMEEYQKKCREAKKLNNKNEQNV